MRKYKLKETEVLDLYRRGKLFEQRYERRNAAGDCTEMHEKMLIAKHEDMELVQQAIEAVKNNTYRELLQYRFILLMTPEEIGAELKQNPETVARKIYRAIHAVKVPEGGIE